MFSKPLKAIYIVIRYLLIILIAGAIFFFVTANRQNSAAFEDVSAAVSAAADTTYMETGAKRFLKKIYHLNAEDYEDALIFIPRTNMDAQELLLIKLRDPSQAESVLAALEERIRSQKQVYEGYAPEQTALLENAVIDEQGDYILYVTGTNAEEVDTAFRSGLQ